MDLTRRGALALGAGVALAGCTTSRAERTESVDPDVALAEAAVAREQTLLAAYAAAQLAHPDLGPRLARLGSAHEAHLAAVTTTALMRPAIRGGSPASTTATPAPVAPVRDTAPVRLAALRALETRTSRAHAQAAVTASRTLAPVLASLAACEASHAAVL